MTSILGAITCLQCCWDLSEPHIQGDQNNCRGLSGLSDREALGQGVRQGNVHGQALKGVAEAPLSPPKGYRGRGLLDRQLLEGSQKCFHSYDASQMSRIDFFKKNCINKHH